jgi:hypothetical protein
VVLLVLAVLGCGDSGGRLTEVVVERGDGWALRVPKGSAVRVSAEHLQVDAADGSRWFDVGPAVLPPGPPQPGIVARDWAHKACFPMLWDLDTPMGDEALFAAGQCTIENRPYWAFVLVEKGPEGWWLSTYLASVRQVPYEDAWADAVRTTFSFRAGSEPRPELAESVVREAVRGALHDDGVGDRPIAGGGLLSGHVVRRLPQVFEGRRADLPLRLVAP